MDMDGLLLGFVYSADADAGFVCIRRTLSRHVTIGTPTVIFCCFTVFDDWYTVVTVLVDM